MEDFAASAPIRIAVPVLPKTIEEVVWCLASRAESGPCQPQLLPPAGRGPGAPCGAAPQQHQPGEERRVCHWPSRGTSPPVVASAALLTPGEPLQLVPIQLQA